GRAARDLRAEGPNLGGCAGSPVAAVDAERDTITFSKTGTAEVAGKTFSLAPGASVQIDGRVGKLADLRAGCLANVLLTVDQQSVRSLGARGPGVAGVATAVDAEKGTITVEGATYAVARDAPVVIGGRQRALADLPVGVRVNLS